MQQQLQQQQQQQQQSDADNIKVVVRLRPLFPHEQGKGAAEVAHVSEDYSSLKVLTRELLGAELAHACAHTRTNYSLGDGCAENQLAQLQQHTQS